MSDVAGAADRIHDAIQQAMNDGLLEPGMLAGWYLVAEAIDHDGDDTIILLSDDQARVSHSLGLIEYARIYLVEAVRDWAAGTD